MTNASINTTRCEEVEIGTLPFSWRDVLKEFREGDEKKYPAPRATMIVRVRGAVCRFQSETGTKFSTSVDEDGYIHIKRIE